MLTDLGRPPEAALAFGELLRLNPNVAEAHAGLGEVFLRRGDRAASTREFREALRVDPTHPMARRWMSEVTGTGVGTHP